MAKRPEDKYSFAIITVKYSARRRAMREFRAKLRKYPELRELLRKD